MAKTKKNTKAAVETAAVEEAAVTEISTEETVREQTAEKKAFKGASFAQKKTLAFILRHKINPETGENILTDKIDALLTKWFVNDEGKIDAYAAKGIPAKAAQTIIAAVLPKAGANADIAKAAAQA